MPDMPYYRCPVEGCDYTDEGETVGGNEGFAARMDEHIEAHKHDLVLITNVEFVEVNGLRCDARAVLIEPPRLPSLGEPRARVRGLGVDPGLPVFTLWLDTGDASFEIVEAGDPTKVLIGDSGESRPIFSGSLLKVGGDGGAVMFLQADDHTQPISVERFGQDDFDPVWRALTARVAKFWVAPFMPTASWVSSESVRARYA